LSRLALRIARPARVFMRARNPCLRLRRRLFGWYVRLVTGSSDPCRGPLASLRNQHREILGALRRPQDYSRGAFIHVDAGISRTQREMSTNGLTLAGATSLRCPPVRSLRELSVGDGTVALPRCYQSGFEGRGSCSHLWIRLLTGAKPLLRPTFSSDLRAIARSLNTPGSRTRGPSDCG
jgi:hypothetical protein